MVLIWNQSHAATLNTAPSSLPSTPSSKYSSSSHSPISSSSLATASSTTSSLSFSTSRLSLPPLCFSIRLGLPYPQCATQASTASGNNFELAIAVCIATFGVSSPQAIVAAVAPLVEVPVLFGMVYVSYGWGGGWKGMVLETPILSQGQERCSDYQHRGERCAVEGSAVEQSL
ncbi:hypothetical protein M427DRAFT_33698 [Gonapodya prolifera JEL478]|uniref:Arsenical-resistance protein n=1 Tax=Gonapodya prolifera (strain JEL478) TaxID=1344416 RepID=A0A139ABD8_GONPJ|nr:hypothetical protein M427DRAFT_33698 [Gonapodya prolifera JEL478]|eukprot:KXS13723.1 hypothetical protein M427DRAFT_33698 [Gonapodya prolifera JEL478]